MPIVTVQSDFGPINVEVIRKHDTLLCRVPSEEQEEGNTDGTSWGPIDQTDEAAARAHVKWLGHTVEPIDEDLECTNQQVMAYDYIKQAYEQDLSDLADTTRKGLEQVFALIKKEWGIGQ